MPRPSRLRVESPAHPLYNPSEDRRSAHEKTDPGPGRPDAGAPRRRGRAGAAVPAVLRRVLRRQGPADRPLPDRRRQVRDGHRPPRSSRRRSGPNRRPASCRPSITAATSYRIYDAASNRLIFSRGFDTMFARVQDDLAGAGRERSASSSAPSGSPCPSGRSSSSSSSATSATSSTPSSTGSSTRPTTTSSGKRPRRRTGSMRPWSRATRTTRSTSSSWPKATPPGTGTSSRPTWTG